MTTRWVDAAYIRGGTSKGLFFRDADLPADPRERDAIFCSALGSPDAFGRQLDGMGGGISSLSKVMVVTASERADADLEYTFGQVAVDEAAVDYSANCGNLSSGVVPFALHAGVLAADDGARLFRLYNVNTGKLVRVRLTVQGGQAVTDGDLVIAGVSSSGAPVELVYPDPAGSRTGHLLPTGNATDTLVVDGRPFVVSLVDATVPLVIVAAHEVGLTGNEPPDALDTGSDVRALLDRLRRAGAVRMGLSTTPDAAPRAAPKIAIVSTPRASVLLDGRTLPADSVDISTRMISMDKAHKAVPGTGAMCVAAAAHISDSVVGRLLDGPAAGSIRLGTPSGVVTVAAVADAGGVREVSLFRTSRILMSGRVAV